MNFAVFVIMTNLNLDTAESSNTAPSPATARPSPPLPPDMEGWLTTQQAADLIGVKRDRFQDYAGRLALPRRKIGGIGRPSYYDPEVIQAQIKAKADKEEEVAAAAAKKRKAERDRKNEQKREQNAPVTSSASASQPADTGDAFHLQALAILGQIVQQHGRSIRTR